VAACCVVGTALCASSAAGWKSSAAGWNQILEIDRDAKMKRTQQRPLVTGVLTKTEATLAATGGVGCCRYFFVLAVGTDPVLNAALGAGNSYRSLATLDCIPT
jgi:protoheme IX farnesyltransferase